MHQKKVLFWTFVLYQKWSVFVMYALSSVFCVKQRDWSVCSYIGVTHLDPQSSRRRDAGFYGNGSFPQKQGFHNSTPWRPNDKNPWQSNIWRRAQPHTVNICNISKVCTFFSLESRNSIIQKKGKKKLPWLHWHLISTFVWNVSLNTWLYLLCTTNSSLYSGACRSGIYENGSYPFTSCSMSLSTLNLRAL